MDTPYWDIFDIGLFRKILLMNRFVIVFNMLSGESIKAHLVCSFDFVKPIKIFRFLIRDKVFTVK